MFAREMRDRLADILSWVRVSYYRHMGVTIGEKCYISLGAHVDVRRGKITIGSNVGIASGSYILGHVGQRSLNEGQETRIEDNVKVYVNAVVLPGIKIGKNSIVGAGSVVTKDVPPDVLVMGNPARVIERLENKDATIGAGRDAG